MIFRFGPFAIDREKFELTNGDRHVAVEPQVLLVILHLIEHRDRVVTRDDLIRAVWHGRIVSDAAIASRIKSARHALGDDGSSQRLIRTVHGRGFRFVGDVESDLPHDARLTVERRSKADNGSASDRGGFRPARRHVVGIGLAVSAAVGMGAFAWRRSVAETVPKRIADMVAQARDAMSQNTRAGQFQAIGILRRVVELMPDYADGWGQLGMAYGIPSHYVERSQALDLRRRGEAAAKRALQLDPGNGFAEIALGILAPFVGSYLTRREHMRRGVEALPGNDDALNYQAVAMQFDGFPAAAVSVYQRIARQPMPPALYSNYIRALWAAGRIEEADRAITDAIALYPAHHTLWLTCYHIRLFSGRAAEALAQLDDMDGWPANVRPRDVSEMREQALALEEDGSARVEALVRFQFELARESALDGETAICLFSALGRIDDAFVLARAYYFGHGFIIPDSPLPGSAFSPEQRQTRWLFEPVTKSMRKDPRFDLLVRDLGFGSYWQSIGIQPDYRAKDSN